MLIVRTILSDFGKLYFFVTFIGIQKLENMKLSLLILFSSFLVLLSCKPNNSGKIPGEYSFANTSFPTKIKWLLNGKTKFFAGTKLKLNEDFSFSFSTCGCETKGDWKMNVDTIYLNHQVIDAVIDTSRCYLPDKYFYSYNMVIGENKNEYIEILTKQK